MTDKPSRPSKGKLKQPFFELEADHATQPARTRICSAWEVIRLAVDELPEVQAALVMLELRRRCDEAGMEKVRQLADNNRTKLDQATRDLPFKAEAPR